MIYEQLSEEECYLYALMMDESGLDLAEFCLIDDTRPDGIFRAWPFQVSWWRTYKRKTIDAAARCLSEGTLVLTEDGWKKIEEVKIGDYVLTHKNRWRPVTNIFDNGIQDTVLISGQGHHTGIVATENHKLWARHARRGSKVKDGTRGPVMSDASFIPAKDFIFTDHSQILTTRWSSPAARAESLPWQSELQPCKTYGRQNYISDLNTNDFFKFLGLYIAEGSIYLDEQYARVELAIHQNEVPFVSELITKLRLNFNTSPSKTDASAKIRINSRPLAEWLNKYISRKANTKDIPTFIYGLDEDKRRALFEGMMFGDGYTRNENRCEYSTSSEKLAFSFRILAQSLGYHVSMSKNNRNSKNYIRGVEIHSGPLYVISCGLNSKNVKIEDGHSWVGLHAISPIGSRHVYDLEVQDDHSYIAEGVVVSNSIGKSASIRLRALAFPFLHAGNEMVVTAPEAIHLQAVTDNIEIMYTNNKLAREMLAGQIKHRPFHINFANGARLMGRIPHHDGKGVKGIHPIWLEHDEAQDYGELGWKEINPTVKDEPESRWRCIAEDQKILTKRGWVDIQNVLVGDEVWTHKNRWRPVLNVFDNGIQDCISITGQCIDKLITTREHKFLLRKKDIKKNEFSLSEWNKLPSELTNKQFKVYWSSPGFYPTESLPSETAIVQATHITDYKNPISFKLEDDLFWSPVESYENIGKYHVYDLEVEEDHSYIVEGIVVSNCHGVTRGIGDTFDEKITGTDSTWHIMRLPAMYRPNWTEQTRQEAIQEYGSYDSPDYKRNILGLPGDGSSPMFVLHRVMAAVDSDVDSQYNQVEYYNIGIDDGLIKEVSTVEDLVDVPALHSKYKRTWIGMDLGWTTSPSAIIVFGEQRDPKKDEVNMKLLSKILLYRMGAEDQVKVMLHLMEMYRPIAFTFDATGAGFPISDMLTMQGRERPDIQPLLNRIKPAVFSQKVIVGFDDSVEINPIKQDGYLDAAIMRPYVEASTDAIRILIDGGKMILPFDKEIIKELQGTQKTGTGNNLDAYGRSGKKKGQHILDAMRMACFSYQSHFIDEIIEQHKQIWVPPATIFV